MAVDPNIIMALRQPQFDNPLEVAGRVAQVQGQQLQIQQAQREEQQQRTLADLFRDNVGADGAMDQQGVMRGMAQSGLGARIPAYQKQMLDAKKSQADLDKTNTELDASKFNLMRDRQDMSNKLLASLLSNPNVSHQDVIAGISGIVQRGLAKPEEGAALVRQLPGRPEDLRSYLLQKAVEGLDAKARLDALLPQFEKIDAGGAVVTGTTNKLTGKFTKSGEVKKIATPGDLLTDKRARDNNNMQKEAARTQVLETGDGVVLVDKGTGVSRPVHTADGKPLIGKSREMTDAQAKANLFGSRMLEANKILGELSAKGVDMPSVVKQGIEGTPLIGSALGAVANTVVASPEQQQVEQAQRDFLNAVLRRESGAVIGESEFASGKKQYFPAVGDSAAVKEQKRRNRELAIQGVLAEVPAARRPGANQTTPRSDIPEDIAAILAKHGGKK